MPLPVSGGNCAPLAAAAEAMLRLAVLMSRMPLKVNGMAAAVPAGSLPAIADTFGDLLQANPAQAVAAASHCVAYLLPRQLGNTISGSGGEAGIAAGEADVAAAFNNAMAACKYEWGVAAALDGATSLDAAPFQCATIRDWDDISVLNAAFMAASAACHRRLGTRLSDADRSATER